jgi:hypothetical protein
MNKQVPVFRAIQYEYGVISQKVMLQSGGMNSCTAFTFKVPVEGNGTQHKANKREGTVKLVRGDIHRGFPNECKVKNRGQEWAAFFE